MSVIARYALLGVVLALVCGCGSGPPQSDEEVLAALRSCPGGDAPWRAAVDLAGSPDEARALAEDLAALADGPCSGRWQPAWVQGRLHLLAGDVDRARSVLGKALARARGQDDPLGVARSADDASWAASAAGELSKAEALALEALEGARGAERADLEAFIENNYAGLLVELGRVGEASEILDRVEASLRRQGLDDAAEAVVFNRAVLLHVLGNAAESDELLRTIRERAEERGDRVTQSQASIVLGHLQLAWRRGQQALAWYETAEAEATSDADRAMALLGQGRAHLARGDDERAVAVLGRAEAMTETSLRPVARVAAAFHAEARRRAGDAAACVERSTELVDPSGEFSVADEATWMAHWFRGRARRDLGELGGAIEDLRAATALLDAQRETLSPTEGLRYLRERRGPYVDLAHAIALEGDADAPARVLEISSALKARALRAASRSGEGEEAAASMNEIRAGLRDDERMIDYLMGDDEGFAVVMSSEMVRLVRLAGRNAWSGALEEARRGGDERARERIARLLLDPLEPSLDSAARVYLVPDVELALLSWGALPRGGDGEPWIARTELAVLPYAAPPPRFRAGFDVVSLAGHPVLGEEGTLPELPWSAYELSSLAEIWGSRADATLVREEFTPDAWLASVGRGADLIHLSTHALASTIDPRRCGIVCARGSRLGLDEIAALDLPGSLVVLSACRTGVGELVPGEGIIGLGWSFMRAGARGVVAQQTVVEDRAAARLMLRYHRQLASGVDPVRALARSVRDAASRGDEGRAWETVQILLNPTRAARHAAP